MKFMHKLMLVLSLAAAQPALAAPCDCTDCDHSCKHECDNSCNEC